MRVETRLLGAQLSEPGLYIAQIAVEMAPICKVGGLGDVVTALGRAVKEQGHHMEIILPRCALLRASALHKALACTHACSFVKVLAQDDDQSWQMLFKPSDQVQAPSQANLTMHVSIIHNLSGILPFFRVIMRHFNLFHGRHLEQRDDVGYLANLPDACAQPVSSYLIAILPLSMTPLAH